MGVKSWPQQKRNTIAANLRFWLLNGQFVTISENYVPHLKINTHNNPINCITTTSRLSATGQRWVNELVEFSFSIHYSPRKQNVIANTFSRPSANTYVECMEACTKLVSADQVRTVLDGAESQHQQSDIWSVCLNTVMIEEQQKILDSVAILTKCFNIDDLKKSILFTWVRQKKPHIQVQVPLLSIITLSPLEVIEVDVLHLEKLSGGFEYMLLLTDHFTRYTKVYPTKNKAAQTAANHVFVFILTFGIPSKILHDQGGDFENDLFKNLGNLFGIQNLRANPYHHQTNGLSERMNQTVFSMLRTFPETYKSSWKNHLSKVIYAYNCTRHSNTDTHHTVQCLVENQGCQYTSYFARKTLHLDLTTRNTWTVGKRRCKELLK